MVKDNIELKFELGTIVLENIDKNYIELFKGFVWDQRTLQWRAPAMYYKSAVLAGINIPNFIDNARLYNKSDFVLKEKITPRIHQKEALEAFIKNGSKGVVCLPTGAGKTFLAIMAITEIKRPTFIVVPTIDLMHQWIVVLKRFFSNKIGVLGGGIKEFGNITVSTYDSALLFMETIGNKYGFLIFDECHHLPAEQYQAIALYSIAPFRLGLSATLERTDGKENIIFDLIGDLVYEGKIYEMISDVLSPYDVVSVEVPLDPDEKVAYDNARKTYLNFLHRYGINVSNGWKEFIIKSSRLPGGKDALKGYLEQKRISQASRQKLKYLWEIILKHKTEKIIIFTNDNALAYTIGRMYVLPVLTHQTKLAERQKMLEAFRNDELTILVTSKVLNEGVDVPSASVAVVVSGSGAVREHVQRLGRILRHVPGKRAVLYELISKETSELYVNKRRKQHHAYQRSNKI